MSGHHITAAESTRQAAREPAGAVATAARHLARQTDGRPAPSGLDDHQAAAYRLAFLASETTALDILATALTSGHLGTATTSRATAEILRSARRRIDAHSSRLGIPVDALDSASTRETIENGLAPDVTGAVLGETESLATIGLSEQFSMVAHEFRRFASDMIEPRAEKIHRGDLDVPYEIIDGLAAMGAFGLSIPEEFGGSQDEETPDRLGMVVATEELSKASLGAGGSLIAQRSSLAR